MENINATLFVYAKGGKIKVLDLVKAPTESEDLLKEGWEHTATLAPCAYLEYLVNSAEDVDVVAEIKALAYPEMNKF